jgi:hypothetical protein
MLKLEFLLESLKRLFLPSKSYAHMFLNPKQYQFSFFNLRAIVKERNYFNLIHDDIFNLIFIENWK